MRNAPEEGEEGKEYGHREVTFLICYSRQGRDNNMTHKGKDSTHQQDEIDTARRAIYRKVERGEATEPSW